MFSDVDFSLFMMVLAGLVLFSIATFSQKYFPVIFIVSSMSILGFMRADYAEQRFQSMPLDIFAHEPEEIIVKGRVVSEPIYSGLYQRFSFDVDTLTSLYSEDEFSVETRVLVSAIRDVNVHYGDYLRIEGELEQPESFITESGREFDYGSYLKNSNISYTMSFAEVDRIETLPTSILGSLYQFKNSLLENIYRLIPAPESGLLAGILFGQDGGLDAETEKKFRIVGLMHIVVLSGYNVSLVIKILTSMLGFLPRVPRSLIAVLGIAAFALLVGAGPTVVRASIMAVFIVLADTLGARYNISRALIIAGICMVLYNPRLLLYDISFQLSFLATYGLIALAPYLERKFSLLPKYFAVKESAVATISAQIMVLPLLIYQIGEFSLISPIVNVLVLFAVPYAMLFGFITSISAYLFPYFSIIFAYISTYFLKYQLTIVDIFAAVPYGSIMIPQFHYVWMFIMYGGIGYWVYTIQKAQRAKV